jgi:hypothetical protein
VLLTLAMSWGMKFTIGSVAVAVTVLALSMSIGFVPQIVKSYREGQIRQTVERCEGRLVVVGQYRGFAATDAQVRESVRNSMEKWDLSFSEALQVVLAAC